MISDDVSEAIAVVGIAGRFPGANNVSEYWENIVAARECITFFSEEDLLTAGVDPDIVRDENYVNARGVLEGADRFDAGFFGLTPREAQMMDPQHRVFLQVAWSAIEDAGYDIDRYDGIVSVYAGSGSRGYLLNNVLPAQPTSHAGEEIDVQIGAYPDYLASAVSYRLNLTGPSVSVQTACSTSLVAVHMACESLLSRESDMALAGGSTVLVPEVSGYMWTPGSVASPDGHCRPFDSNGQGTLFTSGAGVVVLKRLTDALEGGDHIYAVVRGSAVNNDGKAKVGFTAPSVQGQQRVIEEALAVANLSPESIGYIEAHGTATEIGDPIEIEALTRAFRAHTSSNAFCAIGSVKANIGHTVAAAGVAGMIKAIQALCKETIPPCLHFEKPNEAIDFGSSPFFIPIQSKEWERFNGQPRRAGVSSFGLGGTNAHVILEEAPKLEQIEDTSSKAERSTSSHVVVLSAKTETALDRATTNLCNFLKNEHATCGVKLGDLAFTLQEGRKAFRHRKAVVSKTFKETVQILETEPHGCVVVGEALDEQQPVLMFPGGGAQYLGMGAGLYTSQPVYRSAVDECLQVLDSMNVPDVRSILTRQYHSDDFIVMREPLRGLLALFVGEYALAKTWLSFGVGPAAVIGHSVGEYAAACISGILSLEEALSTVHLRGKLFETLPDGGMLSVAATPDEVDAWICDTALTRAAHNAPELCVVSGPAESVDALHRDLEAKGLESQRVHVAVAAHSSMIEEILPAFHRHLQSLTYHPPKIPMVSTVTGNWVSAETVCCPEYWARQLRDEVRFSEAVQTLLQDGLETFVEVGPGRTLQSFCSSHAAMAPGLQTLGSVRHPMEDLDDYVYLLVAAAKLWALGGQIRWESVRPEGTSKRVPAPTYAFDEERHWIEPSGATRQSPSSTNRAARSAAVFSPERVPSPDSSLFYAPTWTRTSVRAPSAPEKDATCLLFLDRDAIGHRLYERIIETAGRVIRIYSADRFYKSGDDVYEIEPGRREHVATVINALGDCTKINVVYAWSLLSDTVESRGGTGNDYDRLYFGILAVGSELARSRDASRSVSMSVLTRGLYDVIGGESRSPLSALAVGPCTVLPQEHENIFCTLIDINGEGASSTDIRHDIDVCAKVLQFGADLPQRVALRNGHWWKEAYEPIRFADEPASTRRSLKNESVVLITGGLGQLGRAISRHLVETIDARLVLVGRTQISSFVGASKLSEHASDGHIRKQHFLREMEEKAAGVLYVSADVSDPEDVDRVVAAAREQFGNVDLVVHAAGLVGNQIVHPTNQCDRDASMAQFNAKIKGIQQLYHALGSEPTRFVLTSSVAAVLGGVGLSAYTSANAFLDALATTKTGREATTFDRSQWLAVDWEIWEPEVGDSNIFASGTPDYALTEQEGKQIFDRALSFDGPVLVISKESLSHRLAVTRGEAHRRSEKDASSRLIRSDVASSSSPMNSTSSSSDRRMPKKEGAMIQVVTGLWREVLGIQNIKPDANFFDLGGHSLLAVKLFSRIYEETGIRREMATIFKAPTIAALAADLSGETTKEEQRQPVNPTKATMDDYSERLGI